MKNIVSIIIPCYNGEIFIDRSISSIFDQDYPSIELIVVDDGSNDNSKERILSWRTRFYARGWALKYIFQDNRGLGGAVNTGLKHVTGEYLTLLDADDRLLPGSISKRAAFLDRNPEYAGVRSNGYRVNKEKRLLFITDNEEKNITDLFSALTQGKTNNWAGTYMVRTNILFEYYPDRNIYPSRYGQNFQILLPVSYKRKIGYLDEPLMEYIIQTDSLSQSSNAETQFQINIRNADGWRDIYIHTIDRILTNSLERNLCMKQYDATYYRALLHWAIEFNIKSHILDYYRRLCETGFVTLDDRIIFYRATNSFLALPLQFIRKIMSLSKIF